MPRHKGDSIGSLMVKMLRCSQEYANGRIQTVSNGWVLSDKGYTNKHGVFLKPRPTLDGLLASLVCAKSTGHCPDPPVLAAPTFETGRFWVTMKECQRCQHYLKAAPGARYPRCQRLIELRTKVNPIEDTARILQQAVENAKQLIR